MGAAEHHGTDKHLLRIDSNILSIGRIGSHGSDLIAQRCFVQHPDDSDDRCNSYKQPSVGITWFQKFGKRHIHQYGLGDWQRLH